MDEARSQHWREKYLSLVEQQEHQVKAAAELAQQLRRGLVRVSLAADGLDPELDQVFSALREQLRSADHQGLGHRLEVVDSAVLAFEEQKKGQQAQSLSALESLTEELQSLNPKNSINKQLKKYSRALKQRVVGIQNYPNLLQELSQLQTLALRDLVEDKPGLLEKLTGLTNKAKTKKEPADEDLAVGHNEDNAEPLSKNSDGEENTYSSDEEIKILLEHATRIFQHILNNIEVVESVTEKAAKTKGRLQSGLQWHDLLPTLKDLCDVITQSHVAANEEFSRYLNSVNKELETICQLAATTIGAIDSEDSRQQKLQQTMESQIQVIESCINDATSLDTLKNEVQTHIQQLRTSLVRPESKKTSLSDQVKQLLGQVENMEQEAQRTVANLSEQKFKAQHDSLTGLPNREAYLERSQLEFKRWARYRNPLTLAVVDIDLFKNVNDSFGHQVGDKVLRLVSSSLKKRLREVDFIARYGGEEFVILLPQTQADGALKLLDDIREGIASTGFHYNKQPVKITVSVGVSEFKDGDELEVTFERADKALYRAKSLGRNRCEVL